uniref:transposase n=1 Tax=Spirosoma sp. SC4-14 TaxID=3128900 RepID=UPI00403F23AA
MALFLLVLNQGFTRFESAKQLVSFAGLAPRVFELGRSVKGKGHICKIGNSRIRQFVVHSQYVGQESQPRLKGLV